MKQIVSEVILDQLAAFGVKRIYGVVGDTIIGLLDALAKQDRIQFIAVKHETSAALMASAEAKLTGRLGVCTATMGPGATNLLNGLGDAYSDKAPVLALTGQAPTNKIGTDYQQYVDQQELFKPFAAYSANLGSEEAIVELLQKAAQISLQQRAVTHLSIPKDLFDKKTSAQSRPLPVVIEGISTFEKEGVEQAGAIMKTAKRPMILAGAGSAKASADLEALAERWGAGILTSLGGKGIFEENSPYLLQGIGEGGNPHAKEIFKEADVVLLSGVTWWPEGYVPQNARIIQIDINLDNAKKGIPAEIAISGKTEDIIPLLHKSLKTHSPDPKWQTTIQEGKEKWAQQNQQEGEKESQPIHPSKVVRAIEKTIAEDAIIALDTGDVTVWMNRNFRQRNQKVLFSGYWRTMGFGLPAAMAAKLEKPERQVVAIVGDGGLQMTLADLLTATRYGLNITVLVFNNQALQMENDKMDASGDLREGTDLTNPDFVKLAEACGWKGFRADSGDTIEAVIQQALNTDSPSLVDIQTAQTFFPETE